MNGNRNFNNRRSTKLISGLRRNFTDEHSLLNTSLDLLQNFDNIGYIISTIVKTVYHLGTSF